MEPMQEGEVGKMREKHEEQEGEAVGRSMREKREGGIEGEAGGEKVRKEVAKSRREKAGYGGAAR